MKTKELKNAITIRSAKAEEVYCAVGMNMESRIHGHNFYEFMICTRGKGNNGYNAEK